MDTLYILHDETIGRNNHLHLEGNTNPIFILSATLTNRGTVELQFDGSLLVGIYDLGSFANLGQLTVAGAASTIGIEADGSAADEGIVRNAGQISVTGSDVHGMYLRGIDLDNSGSIVVGGQHATGVEAYDLFGESLRNSGVIDAHQGGDYSTGVLLHAENADGDHLTRFENAGDISAGTALQVYAADTSVGVAVTNSGSLTGLVRFDTVASLVNTGNISGMVQFIGGDDLYDGRRGHLINGGWGSSGWVAGGGGSNTLLGGRGAERFEGQDHGPQGDNYLSGGGGDDTLVGGGGADTLIGGKGRDVLAGLTGPDTFVFRSVGDLNPDRPDVLEYLDPTDKIVLSHIDADVTRPGNQAFHFVQVFDGQAGEATLTYDTYSATHLELDVNGDGVADAALTLTGDQTGFTSFDL